MTQPVVIVTGASRGIGKAVTLSAIQHFNANVVAVARSKDLLDNLKEEVEHLGKAKSLEVVVGDLTDDKIAIRAVDRAVDRWGRIDGLVANAGILEPMATISDAPVQGWKKLFDINLFSIITLVQEALPHLQKTNGRVINISSGAATKAYRGWGAYGASKAALNHLNETLAVEEPDIISIAVRPGVVDTDMQGLIRQQGKAAMGEFHNKFLDLHKEGKLVNPEDCGHVIASLSLKADKDLSGKFVSWDDEIIAQHRRKLTFPQLNKVPLRAMQQDEPPSPPDDTYNSIRFGDFKSYMERKKRKLKDQEQIILAATNENSSIFSGLTIHVNGYTRPSHADLRRIIASHGGDFQHYLSKSKVTHVVASNLTNAKVKEFRAYKVVTPNWIMDSVEAGKLLSWQDYRLNSPMEVHQKELAFQSQAASRQSEPEKESSNDLISLSPAVSVVDSAGEPENNTFKNLSRSPKGKETAKILGSTLNDALLSSEWARENSTINPAFLDKFYTSSRLHYLSMWKAELKSIVGKLRGLHSSQSQKPKLPRSENTRIMHVDFDCFFASVGTRDRPFLQGKPVAVCHSKGATESSSSSVASCNYEARKFGISNGMSVGHARRYCPSLEVIPYEFDKYKEVSEIFYEILYGFADELEPVSVDEALIDVTSSTTAAGNSEEELATKIRSTIREKTGCEVSIGCGSNILLARLATKKAKPCGQFSVSNDSVLGFLEPILVEDLPGIGYAMEEKLNSLKISTIGDLRGFPMPLLQDKFGKKTGETLYKFARGIDYRPLAVNQARQSVSAEVSWGVRFENDEQVYDFVFGLCKEVQKRLRQIGCRGKSITLKVKRRQLDATEASKHLGHGLCDNFSKSAALEFHTDDAQLIFEIALNLLKSYKFFAGDIRGLGVQIQKLDNDIAKNTVEEGQSILPFTTVKANDIEKVIATEAIHHEQNSNLDPPTEEQRESRTAPVIVCAKPEMEVERQSFMELPLDIQSELHRVYQIIFLEHKKPSHVTDAESNDDLSYEVNTNILGSQQHTDLAYNASQEDADASTMDTSPMELKDMESIKEIRDGQLRTQLDLPPWSQLNPTDLLAMPDNMRQQVLKDYSEKGVRAASNKRKVNGSPVPNSPKRPRNKRAASVRTPTHQTNVKKDGSLSQISGGKKSFTLTQMFPPQSPSKKRLVQDVAEVHNDWDPNVLSELPADIRAELLDEHRRQRDRQQKNFQTRMDNAKAEAHAIRSNPVTTVPVVKKGLMGVTDISGIRELLRSWVSSFTSGPEEEDVATVDTYLMQLAQERDFHQAQLIVQYLTSLVKADSYLSQTFSSDTVIDQSWLVQVDKLRKRLDERVYDLYQCTLKWS